MKKFAFPLNRVLDWRHSQTRLEEAKLERLHAERSAIDAGRDNLRLERLHAEAELRTLDGVTGRELSALDAYQRHVVAEITRMTMARAACERRIAAQHQVVAKKRRDVRLLDRVRRRRLDSWSKDLERETGQQAEESHLAKWNRENT